MKISFFETRTRNSFFQSRASRREREFLFSISCFETRTRNRKSFLMVEREKIKLILTRIPGIENSRYALLCTWHLNMPMHIFGFHWTSLHIFEHLNIPHCSEIYIQVFKCACMKVCKCAMCALLPHLSFHCNCKCADCLPWWHVCDLFTFQVDSPQFEQAKSPQQPHILPSCLIWSEGG